MEVGYEALLLMALFPRMVDTVTHTAQGMMCRPNLCENYAT